jgi:hypothetical protein
MSNRTKIGTCEDRGSDEKGFLVLVLAFSPLLVRAVIFWQLAETMKRRVSEHILSLLRGNVEGLTPRELSQLVYDSSDYAAVSAVYTGVQGLRKNGAVIELTGALGEKNRRYRLVEIVRDRDAESPRAAQGRNRKRGG